MTDTHIKIKPVQPKVQYVGNGSTTVFSYSFAIFDDSDMEVYFGDEKQTTGYTVSGAGQTDGGDVTFSTAPEDGVIVTLVRNVPVERLTDFQEGGTFRAKNINDELDRQTAFVQQVSEELSRCIKVGITSDADPSVILPEIERLYSSADNLDALANDLTNLNTVASDLTNIDAVASNKTNIDTVAGIATNINTVAGDKTNIDAVAADLTNIDTVAGDRTNIDAVAGNKTNIDAVAGNSTNINTIATNISNVGTVANDIENVNTVAENIAQIEDKANKDLDNITNTGKSIITGAMLPDYSSVIDIGGGSDVSSYTPPSNGWIYFQGGSVGIYMYYDSSKTSDVMTGGYLATGSSNASCFVPVIGGHTYYFNAHSVTFRRFFPCIGG